MKLSCLPVSLFPQLVSGEMPLWEWARFAKQAGLDGFDASCMFLRNHTVTGIDEIAAHMGEDTAAPVMVTTYPDFTHPDALERERQLHYLCRDISLASRLGFSYMRVTAGQNHPGLNFDEAVAHVLEGFAKASQVAQRMGVRLVFENHAKPGAWHKVDFSFDPRAFLAICEGMRHLPIGVNYDTANAAACGADEVALLRQVIGQVETVHLNDTSSREKLDMVLVGTGLVRIGEVFSLLRKKGFDGWVCIEEGSGMGRQGVQKAVQFARQYVY